MKTQFIFLFAVITFSIISPTFGQQKTGAQWEAEGQQFYEYGHNPELTPDARAEAFKKAAERFEKAAEAYKAEGSADKAEAMKTRAGQIRKYKVQMEHDEASTRPETKPRRAVSSSGLHLGVGLIVPPSSSTITQGSELLEQLNEAVFSDPVLLGYLFERLGGEFFIGDPNNGNTEGIAMSGSNRVIPGISMGLGFCSGLELGLRVHQFSASWSGTFPYTVFPGGTGRMGNYTGALAASATGLLGDVQARYYLPGRMVRPYLGVGARGQWVFSNSSSAEMAGVALPFEMNPVAHNTFSAFGDAGIRFYLGRSAYLQAGASYARGPVAEYAVMGEVGLGWRFSDGKRCVNR
ncbi:MAG: hypothetical protein KF852_05245 [Saprospiraceae bacterium]|nr:hypothetical protein [Saprospiraceae bacterium]